jgi:Mg-chelatase subunit ChlD
MKTSMFTGLSEAILPSKVQQQSAYYDCLILDLSGSMFGRGFSGKRKIENIENATQALMQTKRESRPYDHIAFVAYHDIATILCEFLPVGLEFAQLAAIVSRLSSLDSGGTHLVCGLEAAYKIIRHSQRWPRRYELKSRAYRVIAYSDGEDFETDRGIRAAENLKALGVVIDCFGVAQEAHEVNESFLRSVATEDADGVHYRFLGDEDTLQRTFIKIATGTLTIDD